MGVVRGVMWVATRGVANGVATGEVKVEAAGHAARLVGSLTELPHNLSTFNGDEERVDFLTSFGRTVGEGEPEVELVWLLMGE